MTSRTTWRAARHPALAFPYVYPFGYVPNNLLVAVETGLSLQTGVDLPTASGESASRGRATTLFE